MIINTTSSTIISTISKIIRISSSIGNLGYLQQPSLSRWRQWHRRFEDEAVYDVFGQLARCHCGQRWHGRKAQLHGIFSYIYIYIYIVLV